MRPFWKKGMLSLTLLIGVSFVLNASFKRLVWASLSYFREKPKSSFVESGQSGDHNLWLNRIAWLEVQLAEEKRKNLENARLRRLCGWIEKVQVIKPESLVTCRILDWTSFGQKPISRPFHVPVGSSLGFSARDWVFASDGRLVGVVSHVDPETAEIQPLFHPEFRLEAETEKTQEDLLLAGKGSGMGIVLKRTGTTLQPKEKVYAKSPYAFLIGTVDQTGQGVESCCDWRNLPWVHVLKASNEAERADTLSTAVGSHI